MFVCLCPQMPNTSHSRNFWQLLRPARRPQFLGSSHREEYPPYFPPGEGRHSIWPPQCQNGDGDILGNLCFCTPPSTLFQCDCVCMYLSSPSFPRKELRIYECMGRRERHLQRRMSVSCKQLGGGACVCGCVSVCGWTASIETLSSNTWGASSRGGVLCESTEEACFWEKAHEAVQICDWQLTLLITAPQGQTPDNSCCFKLPLNSR